MKKNPGIILLVIAIILGIAQLYFCSCLGTSGVELGKIEEKIQILEAQNREIEGEIARLSSLAEIQKRAVSLGFQTRYAFSNYSSQKIIAQNQ
jgi:cell division protein FtsL